jgi:hypothetical protein
MDVADKMAELGLDKVTLFLATLLNVSRVSLFLFMCFCVCSFAPSPLRHNFNFCGFNFLSSYSSMQLGYQYINIDDCWAIGRDSNGVIVPDPLLFPNGIKAVADYVHSKGFKFGLYSDRSVCMENFTQQCTSAPMVYIELTPNCVVMELACRGQFTCKLRPGSQGYEVIDANTYAEWGACWLIF